jgi:hypothetical protein
VTIQFLPASLQKFAPKIGESKFFAHFLELDPNFWQFLGCLNFIEFRDFVLLGIRLHRLRLTSFHLINHSKCRSQSVVCCTIVDWHHESGGRTR